jgi:hypothetical protein
VVPGAGLSQYNRTAADETSTNVFRWSELMPKVLLAKLLLTGSALMSLTAAPPAGAQTLFPADQATMVNPDVQLKLTFKGEPHIGVAGKIVIYDAADGRPVDTLDLSIPPGPTTPVDRATRAKNYLAFPYPYARTSRSTNANTKPGTPSAGAVPTSDQYQLTIIGGFTDGFQFCSARDARSSRFTR